MADIYVRSTDGSNADSGATWALAKADLTGAAAIDAAGDTIWLSQSHAESTAGAVSIALAGTPASPVRVLCGNDAAAPPTALASTASVTTTGANTLAISGSAYFYGVNFTVGSTITLNNGSASNTQTYENCSFYLTNNGSAGQFRMCASNNATFTTTLINPVLRFTNANNYWAGNGALYVRGGSFHASTATPTSLLRFDTDRSNSRIEIDGMDFSNLASTVNLFAGGASSVASGRAVLRNCRLPASWSGGLLSSAPAAPGQRYEMWNCDSADTNYRVWIEEYAGSIKHNTAIYRDGFSGGTKHSYVFASTANASYPAVPLTGPDFFADNSTTGSSVTATVEVVTDGVTLKDDEAWLEVMYMGTSGVPLGTWVRDCKADVLATAANQTTSTESWTTTGLASPVKQKLSVTFTPQEAGYVIGRVMLAKASTTVYVDPQLTLT